MTIGTEQLLVGIVALAAGFGCLAAEAKAGKLPPHEIAALKAFFKDFSTAFNERDFERIKKLSGDTWNQWPHDAEAMSDVGEMRLEFVDAVSDGDIDATVKVSVSGKNGEYGEFETVDTVKKSGGSYVLVRTDIAEDVKDAMRMMDDLIQAVNARNLDGVRKTLSFGDEPDFEARLAPRDLAWIKAAIDNGAKISKDVKGVGHDKRDGLVGFVDVSDASDGRNVRRRFVFKGAKIDRGLPVREAAKPEKNRVAK